LRPFGYACALALVGACGPSQRTPVGVSSGAPREDAGIRDAARVPGDAGIPADYETAFAKMNAARFVSNGHAAGRWDVDVFTNDKDTFVAARGEVPVGTKLLKVHYELGGAAGRGPVMMMEKREPGYDPEHGDWRYVVVASTGELVKDGPIAACAGCHDDAPHDHIFRVRE
jgi:hypothetical protein